MESLFLPFQRWKTEAQSSQVNCPRVRCQSHLSDNAAADASRFPAPPPRHSKPWTSSSSSSLKPRSPLSPPPQLPLHGTSAPLPHRWCNSEGSQSTPVGLVGFSELLCPLLFFPELLPFSWTTQDHFINTLFVYLETGCIV